MLNTANCQTQGPKSKHTTKITQGTKEWADSNVNCVNGCSHDCRYCYAKKMATRFDRKTDVSWKTMEIRKDIVKKKFQHRDGRIMFPTSHDILPDEPVLSACLTVIQHLLDAKNSLLITTKPHLSVVREICQRFQAYRELIQFRFTITTEQNALLSFWEPGAPLWEERLASLQHAFANHFKTSISIEPFLSDPRKFIPMLLPYVTESIWVGPMNYVKANNISKVELPFYQEIRNVSSVSNLLQIHNTLKNTPKIRFKDAFTNRLVNADLL